MQSQKLLMPHRRFNPLLRRWVLVSPHRTQRPWLGQVEKAARQRLPAYDPTCYLCPGNQRAGDKHNPHYTSTFVFDNDFPALLKPEAGVSAFGPETSTIGPRSESDLFQAEPVNGVCRVVCFSPRHDLSLPELPLSQVRAVVETWKDQTLELGELEYVQYVQVFENKGAMMGCSNPHPHSQIWATSMLPDEIEVEIDSLSEYLCKHDSCLLCDYLEQERDLGERIIIENEGFTALTPYWAVWPFEVLVLSRRHFASLSDLTNEEIASLAEILRKLTTRYDNLFETSFPYSMGFHQAPVDGTRHVECHFHAHFYPPLLRSATVRKFMVGFEMLAMPQRDLTPESAAERLRLLEDIHYLSKGERGD